MIVENDTPKLVELAQRVLDECTCLRVHTVTGEEIHQSDRSYNGMLLDMQSAQVVVQVYGAMSNKKLFQQALDKVGACHFIQRLWTLYSSKR